jgi:hypothetical protein
MATGPSTKDTQDVVSGVQPEEDAFDPTSQARAAQSYPDGSYRVLTGALVLNNGLKKEDGSSRVGFGRKVHLKGAIHDIGKLISLRAIEPWDDNNSIGKTTAAKLRAAANSAAQTETVDALPDGRGVEDGNAQTTASEDGFKNVEAAPEQ